VTADEQSPAGWSPPRPWHRAEAALVGVLALVALLLRLHDDTAVPTLEDNQDPVQFAWAGLTLITRGVPYSWEVFTHSYRYDFVLHLNGSQYSITHPWLSHPPLFPLLVGSWAYLQGARDFHDVTPAMIWPVAIGLSVLSLALAYALARRVFGTPAALLGTAFLAVSPGAVLLGRAVETEALLAPLFLGALLVIHRGVSDGFSRRRVAGLLAICALMPLVKVTGIVVAGALAAILLTRGAWRLAVATVVSGVVGLGLYAAYGAFYDWTLFIAVITEWRDVYRHGVMAGLEFIADSAGVGRGFRDGWFHLGWLGVAYLAMRRPQGPGAMLLAWPCVVYAAGVALLGEVAVQGRYGWYRLVLYPVLYAAAGLLAWEAIRKPSLPALLLVIVLAGGTATEAVVGHQWQPNPYFLGGVIALTLLPAAIATWRIDSAPWRLTARVAAGTAVAAILVAAAVTSYQLGDVYRLL
jgi:hypothetical protein